MQPVRIRQLQFNRILKLLEVKLLGEFISLCRKFGKRTKNMFEKIVLTNLGRTVYNFSRER